MIFPHSCRNNSILQPPEIGLEPASLRSWFESYRQDYIIGVGSELLYLHMVKHFNVAVTEVPMSLMPMQRVARFHGQLCLHKYCDAKLASKNLPYFHPDMPLCKE